MAKKRTAKKKPVKKATVKKAVKRPKARKGDKRELINTGTDKRYVKRDDTGRFEDVVDVGRSLSQDRRRKAKKKAKPGHGDRGD